MNQIFAVCCGRRKAANKLHFPAAPPTIELPARGAATACPGEYRTYTAAPAVSTEAQTNQCEPVEQTPIGWYDPVTSQSNFPAYLEQVKRDRVEMDRRLRSPQVYHETMARMDGIAESSEMGAQQDSVTLRAPTI